MLATHLVFAKHVSRSDQISKVVCRLPGSAGDTDGDGLLDIVVVLAERLCAC